MGGKEKRREFFSGGGDPSAGEQTGEGGSRDELREKTGEKRRSILRYVC